MQDLFKVKQAYLNDPVYHAVVDSLVHLMAEAQLSPSEVRAIAMFAVTRFEEMKVFKETQYIKSSTGLDD